MEPPALRVRIDDHLLTQEIDGTAQKIIRRAWRHFVARRNVVLSRALRRLCPPPTPQASVMNPALLPLTPVSSSCSEDASHQFEVLLWMEAITASYLQERETFKRYQRQHVRNVRNRRWSIGEKSRPREIVAFLPQAVLDASHIPPSTTPEHEVVTFLGFAVEAPPMLSVAPLSSPASSAPASGRSSPPNPQPAVSSPQMSFPPYVIRVSDDQQLRDAVAMLRGADSKSTHHRDRSVMLSPVLLSPRNYSLSASTHQPREVVRILDIPADVAQLMNRSISGNSSVAEAPSPPLFLDHNENSDPFLSGRNTAIDEVARSMSFLAPEGSTWPRRGSIPRVSPNQVPPEWLRGGLLGSHYGVKEQSGALNVEAAKKFEWITQPAAYAAARRLINLHNMNDIAASFDVSEGVIHFGGSRRQSLLNESGDTDSQQRGGASDSEVKKLSDDDNAAPPNRLPLVDGDVTPIPKPSTPPPRRYHGGGDDDGVEDYDRDCPPTITVDGYSARPSPIGPDVEVHEQPIFAPLDDSVDEIAPAATPPPAALIAPAIIAHQFIAVSVPDIVMEASERRSPWSTQVIVSTSFRDDAADVSPPSLSAAATTAADKDTSIGNGSFSFVEKHRRSLGRSMSTSNNSCGAPRNAIENYAKRHCQIKPFSSYGALMEVGPKRGSPTRNPEGTTVSPVRDEPVREKSPLSRSGTPNRVRPDSTRPKSLRERIEEQRRLLKTDPQICGIVDRQVAMLGTLRRSRQPKAQQHDEAVERSAIVRPGSAMSNSDIFTNPTPSPARLVTRAFTPAVERTRFVITSQSRVPPLLRSHVPTQAYDETQLHNTNASYTYGDAQSLGHRRTSTPGDRRQTRASLLAPSAALKRKNEMCMAKERSALEPTRVVVMRVEHNLQQQRPQTGESLRDTSLHSRLYPHALPSHANSQGNIASREDVEWLKKFHATSYY